MNSEIRTILERYFKVSPNLRDQPGQFVGCQHWLPQFDDQSLEMFIHDIEDHYANQLKESEKSFEDKEEKMADALEHLNIATSLLESI